MNRRQLKKQKSNAAMAAALQKANVTGSCRATVDRCTLQQLISIGIDEDLIGREVDVLNDTDFYNPMLGECVGVRVDNMFAGLQINATYLIPKVWMSFGNCQ